MCAATCVVAPRASASVYFFRIVRIAMSACLVHILVSLLHFPLIPWVVVVVRMYSSNFLALLFLLRFLLRFLLILAFPGLAAFFFVCAYKLLMSPQVDWCFEGPAVVVAFVFKCFLLARILAFWVLFNVVEFSYR